MAKKGKGPPPKSRLDDALERQRERQQAEAEKAARDEKRSARGRGDIEEGRAAAKAEKEAAPKYQAGDLLGGYEAEHHKRGTKFDRAVDTYIPKEEAMICCLPRRVCCSLLFLLVLLLIGGVVCVILFWGDIIDAITK